MRNKFVKIKTKMVLQYKDFVLCYVHSKIMNKLKERKKIIIALIC